MARDEFAVEYTERATGDRRRVRYEPREDGGMYRVEEVRRGCEWRTLGREPVSDVVDSAALTARLE